MLHRLLTRFLPLGILGALGALAGCSVYAPLQPGAPLVHRKGEAEVVTSAYASGRLEGSAAYSPAKHLVVRAAGGLRGGGGDSTYFRIRQAELGIGTYRYLDGQWLLGGMVGYGRGRSSRRFRDNFETIWRDSLAGTEYAARFHKFFADVYVASEVGRITYGGACRLSQVRFGSLTNRGQDIPLRTMTRLEPMFFMRFKDARVAPWLRLQLATSLSLPANGKLRSPNQDIRNTKEGRLYTSIGLVIYPHLFKEY